MKPLHLPSAYYAIALLFLVAAGWAALSLSTAQPWLGISLQAQGEQVKIVKAVPGGPAQNLQIDSALKSLRNIDGQEAALSARTIIEEPDLLTDYRALNAFFSEQNALYTILDRPFIAQTDAGDFEVTARFGRPLGSLPFVFWFQLFCGIVAFITGVSIATFRPKQPAARALMLTGFAFVLVTFSAAVYSSRELALEGSLFRLLSSINHLGSLIFAAGFTAIFWHYPASLGPRWVAPGFIALYLLIWTSDTWQWAQHPDYGFRLPIVFAMTISIVLATIQWRKNRHNLPNRRALEWFLLSLIIGGGAFVVSIISTALLGINQPLAQGYAFGFILIMYLGVALGVLRYRLFDLEAWWMRIWLGLIGGATVIAADLLFVHLLSITKEVALGLALALVGWGYFPLRYWFLSRFFPEPVRHLQTRLPQVLRLILASNGPSEREGQYQKLLEDIFAPLYIQKEPRTVDRSQIESEGTELLAARLGEGSWRLGYKNRGKQLFRDADRTLADSLHHLTTEALKLREGYERGVNEERNRIADDLHDELGGRLLTLLHQSRGADHGDAVRAVIHELRNVVGDLGTQPATLQEAAAQWQREAEARCKAAGCQMRWHLESSFRSLWLEIGQRVHLGRMIKEALSNALRHSGASEIEVRFQAEGGNLSIFIGDNGRGFDPAKATGRGLHTLRRRARLLGGSVTVLSAPGQGTRVAISIPEQEQP